MNTTLTNDQITAGAAVMAIPTAIMNLPPVYQEEPGDDYATGYATGHRDARHAAADLVLARADELKALAAPSPQIAEKVELLPLSAGLPSPDDHNRILVYTDGVDFAGQQYFDIKADDLWEPAPEDRNEIVEAATHWMPLPRPGHAIAASHRAAEACEHCNTERPLHLLNCPVAVKGMAEGKKKEAREPLRQLLIDLSNNTYFCGLHLSDDLKYAGYMRDAETAEQGIIELFEEIATPAPASAGQAAPAEQALRKLCAQLSKMQRRLRPTPGTGQNHSYLMHEDVEAYVEEARKSLAAQPAEVSAGQASQVAMTADELAALRRFYECAADGEGYDVPKPMMRRLSEIGVVQRISGAYYHTTEYGLAVLDSAESAAAPAEQKGGAA